MNLRSTASLILVCSFLFSATNLLARRSPLTKGDHDHRDPSASEKGPFTSLRNMGFFRKYSVDVSFVQVRNGAVGMAALSSGETQFHGGSVSAANLGAIAEGADLVFVAGFVNRDRKS